jgi:signal peptide peptidase SppA
MKLLDLMTGPWALLPEQLRELQAIYATHLRGDKIDLAGVEARLGRPLANEQQTYQLREGGVAVLPIEGVLAPKMNMFTRISGGASTQLLAQQVQSLRADPRVQAVVLRVDSPGGSVLGGPALAEAVRALAAEKATVAVAEGTMASMAYWVGSAANAVYVEGVTDQVGSIGVYSRLSWEPQDPNSMEFTRGRYKRAGLNGSPPSAEVVAYHEQQLDHLYTVFVDAVAAHRQVSADVVLERMADGRVFVGQQAIDAGLVDGVSTVDAMAEQLATNPAPYRQRRKAFALGAVPPPLGSAGAAVPSGDLTTPPPKGIVMPDDTPQALTRESLERDHAALFAALRGEFTAAGAAAERERIQAVRAQGAALPGHEALVERLAFDGVTTGPDAAVQLLQAEATARQGAAAQHFNQAPPAAAPSAAPLAEAGKPQQERTLAQQALATFRNLTTRQPQEA